MVESYQRIQISPSIFKKTYISSDEAGTSDSKAQVTHSYSKTKSLKMKKSQAKWLKQYTFDLHTEINI